MRNLPGFIVIFILWGTSLSPVLAQKTEIYLHDDVVFNQGLELFEKEKFSAAQQLFFQVKEKYKDPNTLVRTDAEFYIAVCAEELFHKDAEWLLEEFISTHPESPKTHQAYFHLGKYNFRKKKYKETIHWLTKLDVMDLPLQERDEYYFTRGYSYFETRDFEKAQKDLITIKDKDGRFSSPAMYYYAHIAYGHKNYETALIDLRKLSKDELFGPIVPYYISQILFFQGKYDEVIIYAPPLLTDTINARRIPEIARIIGESYFRKGKYGDAVIYLEKYQSLNGYMDRAEWYQLGYSYYKAGSYSKAANCFQNSVEVYDSLSQNAFYHLADCFIQMNMKPKAVDAFFMAYKIGPDPVVKEDALYNYAKLSFELSYNPFNEAIKAFETYLKDYPDSPRKDEALSYLSKVYVNAKNYEAALKSIESIKNLPPDLKPVYQRIAYLRGVQLYTDNQLSSAVEHFTKSMQYPMDKEYTALALYWKASGQYSLAEKLKNNSLLDEAIKNFKAFLFETGASNTPYFIRVNYDLGYCYFRKLNWNESNSWFRKFVASKPEQEVQRLTDSYLRIADGFFKLKDYFNAADYYDLALKNEEQLTDADYALFQKGMVLGLSGKTEAKITALEELLNKYTGKTSYAAPAMFELAKSYALTNNNEKAYQMFEKITKEQSNSKYVASSLLQMGNLLNKKKKYDEALTILYGVMDKYPKTETGLEAVHIITEICKNKGDMDCLEKVSKVSWANMSVRKLDSNAYQIAKEAYFKEDYEDARKNFGKYIQKFPDGIFILDAWFYKAESDYKLNDLNIALGGYNYVIERLPNRFAEISLAKASYLQFKSGNYEIALKDYILLETYAEFPAYQMDAKVGQMRCNFLLKNYEAAITAGQKVLATEKPGKDLLPECHITIAKSALEKGDLDLAWNEFKETIKTSQGEKGAEARYNLGYIQFLRGQYKESQKSLLEVINLKPSYSYWSGKSFILIADNYAAMNDLFNAKFTLKTYLEKSTNAELSAIAQQKLAKLIELEKTLEEQKRIKQEPLKIDFNNDPDLIPNQETDSLKTPK